MANPEHLALLEQGVEAWKNWRQKHPGIKPDLSKVNLIQADLSGADLAETNLKEACLNEAILFKAILRKADLEGADLHEADLRGADFCEVKLGEADLPGWNEFNDPQITDWKRVRGVIEHEDNLINHRFTWLLVSQTILFTALGAIYKAWLDINKGLDEAHRLFYELITIILSFVGMWIAYYMRGHLYTGKVYHDELVNWWDKKYGKKNWLEMELETNGRHPKICGHLSKWRGLELHNFPLFFSLLGSSSYFFLL